MEKSCESLMAERDELKLELNHQLERNRWLEEEKEKLQIQIETLAKNAEDLRCALSRAEGCAEAYSHCIDAMNGIQHEKKVGFRHAGG